MNSDISVIDERIQSIVKKMEGFAGKQFTLGCGEFPPVWDKPYPIEKVEAFEKEKGIILPLEYKRFITTFASSGTQPFYGFMPLFDGEDEPDVEKKFLYTIRKPLNVYNLSKEEYAQIYIDRTVNVDQGYVMLTHEGCAMYSILIVNTDDPETYGTVWFEYYVDKTLSMGEDDYFSYGELAWVFQ